MRQSQTVTLPGINIQAPWAEAIVSGHKVIETRFYPMPRKWLGQPLAIIETPGKARHFQRRIAGLVLFAPSWCYADKAAFARDRARHGTAKRLCPRTVWAGCRSGGGCGSGSVSLCPWPGPDSTVLNPWA